MKRLGLVFLALAQASCLWGRFDDLKSSTWVYKVERDEEKTQGAFGVSLATMPVDRGARIAVGSGTPPSGLAVLNFDETGELTQFIGLDADPAGVASGIEPLISTATPDSLAALDANTFVAGIGVQQILASFPADLGRIGTTLATGTVPDVGKWVRAGRINAGPDRDVVGIGRNQLVVVLDAGAGTPTVVTCTPQAEMRGLALGDLDGDGLDEIVVAIDLDKDPNGASLGAEIRVYRLADVQAGCTATGFANVVAWPFDREIGLSVGQLDGAGGPEVIAGNTILVDFQPNVTVTKVVLAPPTGASSDFGARSLVTNLDGTGPVELIVSDPRATVGGEGSSGRVHIFQFNGTAATQIAELTDPKPKEELRFGLDIATAPFPTATSPTQILAVGGKDTVWVYFKATAAAPDPRAE